MSLSPFDSFQSRFGTYLLNFPRINKYVDCLCLNFALFHSFARDIGDALNSIQRNTFMLQRVSHWSRPPNPPPLHFYLRSPITSIRTL